MTKENAHPMTSLGHMSDLNQQIFTFIIQLDDIELPPRVKGQSKLIETRFIIDAENRMKVAKV